MNDASLRKNPQKDNFEIVVVLNESADLTISSKVR
jgi:hypothetical protein